MCVYALCDSRIPSCACMHAVQLMEPCMRVRARCAARGSLHACVCTLCGSRIPACVCARCAAHGSLHVCMCARALQLVEVCEDCGIPPPKGTPHTELARAVANLVALARQTSNGRGSRLRQPTSFVHSGCSGKRQAARRPAVGCA